MLKTKERILYLDFIRIVAIFIVIFMHIAASNWDKAPVESFDWIIFNIYCSAARSPSALFIMVSGCIFLNPNRTMSLEVIFKKRIFKIVTAFAFWSFSYAIIGTLFKYKTINSTMLADCAKRFIVGHYHLWFLYTIVGLYMVIPFLKSFCHDKRLCEYFILLSIIFASFIPLAQKLPILEKTTVLTDNMNMFLVMGYTGHFVMGYYLSTYDISKKLRTAIYCLVVPSFIFTVWSTDLIYRLTGEPSQIFYHPLTPNNMIITVGIFIFFKYNISKLKFSSKQIKIILLLSEHTFGMYLVHSFFNIIFQKIGFTSTSFNPVLSVPLISIVVFICSFVVVYFIKKIPYISKYIV